MEPQVRSAPPRRIGTWTMAAVMAALLVPIGLRHLSSALEIYPAVLMPVGAGTVDLTTEHIPVVKHDLMALLVDGRTIELDPRSFLGPLSGRIWPRWAGSSFGTKPKPRQAIMGRIGLPPRPAASNVQRDELVQWLQHRARETGIGPLQALYIIRHDQAVDLHTGELIAHGRVVVDTLDLDR